MIPRRSWRPWSFSRRIVSKGWCSPQTGPAAMYFEPPISNFREADRDGRSCDSGRRPSTPCRSTIAEPLSRVTRHILSLGHTNVAAIAGWKHLANTTGPIRRLLTALEQAGSFQPKPSDVVYADFRRDRARELCHTLLAAPRRPTALFVSNNEMVIGAMQAIAELGLSCPREISLAGIDDFPWAEDVCPLASPLPGNRSRRWPNTPCACSIADSGRERSAERIVSRPD